MVSMTADLDGSVHFLDYGGSGTPLVCVHGLGGSAINWMAVGPGMTRQNRVLALDLPGFGYTPLGGRSASLEGSGELLDRFLREVAGSPVVLVGSSMGGLLALQQAARQPDTVHAIVLVDPALPWPGRNRFDLRVWAFFGALTAPGVAGRGPAWRSRRLGAERLVHEMLAAVCVQPDRVPRELVQAQVEQVLDRLHASNGDTRALSRAGRSLLRALARKRYDAVYGAVRAPVLVVHGDRDRLVPVESSLTLAQEYGWLVSVLHGVGHVPMMEAPEEFLQAVRPWLVEVSRAA
jgi:pimeloyl-ACP methyl ester carboxylesterase